MVLIRMQTANACCSFLKRQPHFNIAIKLTVMSLQPRFLLLYSAIVYLSFKYSRACLNMYDIVHPYPWFLVTAQDRAF